MKGHTFAWKGTLLYANLVIVHTVIQFVEQVFLKALNRDCKTVIFSYQHINNNPRILMTVIISQCSSGFYPNSL